MEIYKDEETKKKFEDGRISASFPLDAKIEDGMQNLTLEQFAQILIKQFAAQNVVGINIIEIRFNKIFEP